jgi:transcription antitermination factor NusG
MEPIDKTDLLAASWRAVYTRHQHEKMISRLLSEKGFEVFLPLYQVRRRWKDRVKELSLPLFPCYVFIQGGFERRLDIVTTPGIHGFVTLGNAPAVIPEQEIEGIRQAVTSGALVEPHPFLKCGDWVRIRSGPLEGIEGILVRKKNSLRLVLSVELLQKSISMEVDASSVERMRSGSRPSDDGLTSSTYTA